MSDLKKKLNEWKGVIQKELLRQLDAQTKRNSYATISNEVLDGVRYNWYMMGSDIIGIKKGSSPA